MNGALVVVSLYFVLLDLMHKFSCDVNDVHYNNLISSWYSRIHSNKLEPTFSQM